jgi:hypothetical protein
VQKPCAPSLPKDLRSEEEEEEEEEALYGRRGFRV